MSGNLHFGRREVIKDSAPDRSPEAGPNDALLDSRRVRVLHVLNELRASGAEVMLRSAAPEWDRHGIDAHILAVAPAAGAYAEELRAAGYGVVHEPDEPLRAVPARLRRHVRAGGYDVVHLHAERGNFWFALAARSAGAAVIRTVHNAFEFTGPLHVRRTAQRRLLRSAGVAHVGVGPGVADNERRRFGNPVEVVENWYDSVYEPPTPRQRAMARAAWRLADHHLAVVSVGNCAPVKRHETILDAMAHPDAPPHMVYLHVGEERADRGERRLAERLGVSDRTRFGGRVHPLEALHAADVFVMPSAHEGLSIAALEALATGLPAVLADVPGLRDMAEVTPAAVLTDVAPDRLVAAIGRAAGLPEPQRSGRSSIADVRERFGMARGVAHYARIYRKVARSPQRRWTLG